ncbi:hypothetical protein ACFZCF_10135 [Streptomyces sp. NPDC007945]|uniref:hypothetical protein n=1 Tax=Streptomyces sp. NPDC007945 TaxID=3364797 RepID=UPI0036F173F4
MGGDCWWQTGPYEADLAVAFRRAQEDELAEDDRGFPGRTIDELWRSGDWAEYIFTGGTATVLDQVRTADATEPETGPYMRPLTEEEVRAWCPHGKPTAAEWTAALGADLDLYPSRGLGRCTVLYEGGEPTRIGYWGVTAD